MRCRVDHAEQRSNRARVCGPAGIAPAANHPTTGGGWLAIHWFGGGLPALFTAIAVALVVYGTMVAGAVKAGAWREKIPRLQAQSRD
jgi:hypothetical protein